MPHSNIISSRTQLLRLYESGAVFTAFDTETTGLNAATAHVIEIGAVQFSKQGIMATYNVLVNPCCPVPPEAVQINHISNEMLQDCPLIEQVLPDFLSFIGSSILVAHNVGFDLSFINAELNRSGFNPLKNSAVDTVQLSRQIFPQLPNHKLQTLANCLHIDAGTAHRAQDDARVCMKIFQLCLSHGENC